MNNCTHFKSLVPIDNTNDFLCTKCGWKFLVLHITDYESQTSGEILRKGNGQPVMINLSSEILKMHIVDNEVEIRFKRKDVGYYAISFDKKDCEKITELSKLLRKSEN